MITISLILGLLIGSSGNFPDPNIYSAAQWGYQKLHSVHKLDAERIVIIDYGKPSSEKRLYVIDTKTGSILLETYVAHGKNSGELMANTFSNEVNSNQSSLGFFRIAEKYRGKHGISYRLDGLENGVNNNARERALVIHAAWYANPSIITQQGRLGRSLGCPALPENIYSEFQELIRPGTLLFVYYPDEEYFGHSDVFNDFDGRSGLAASE